MKKINLFFSIKRADCLNVTKISERVLHLIESKFKHLNSASLNPLKF